MICLEDIKVALVDYDDTACIHRHLRVDDSMRKNWNKALIENDEDFYMDDSLYSYSPALQWLLGKLNEYGAKGICMTWSETNRLYEARRKFLLNYYGSYITDLVMVGTREGKLSYAESMSEVLNIPKRNILIIEDHPSTILEFRRAGFKALSMSEVCLEYEAETDKQFEELLERRSCSVM